MDDISRIQIFAAPPPVAEVVFKMNRAHSLLEESLGEGDWTLNASKTANVIMMREEGANATTRVLIDKRRGLRGVACSEARLLGPYLKAKGNVTAEIGRRATAARRGWRQCGSFWKAMVPKRVNRGACRGLRVKRGEDPDRRKQNMFSAPGPCCRLLTSCKCERYDGTRAGPDTRKTTTRW